MTKKSQKLAAPIKSAATKDKVSTTVVVASLEKTAAASFRKVTNLTIKTKEDFETMAETVKALKVLAKEAERQEKEITGPLKEVIKKTQQLFRPFQAKVEVAEVNAKNAMQNFLETQKKSALRLEQKFEQGDIKKLSTLVTKQNELRVDNGTAQVRKVWKLFIDNEGELDRNFLMPDEERIKEYCKKGIVPPGCRWEQVDSIAI